MVGGGVRLDDDCGPLTCPVNEKKQDKTEWPRQHCRTPLATANGLSILDTNAAYHVRSSNELQDFIRPAEAVVLVRKCHVRRSHSLSFSLLVVVLILLFTPTCSEQTAA